MNTRPTRHDADVRASSVCTEHTAVFDAMAGRHQTRDAISALGRPDRGHPRSQAADFPHSGYLTYPIDLTYPTTTRSACSSTPLPRGTPRHPSGPRRTCEKRGAGRRLDHQFGSAAASCGTIFAWRRRPKLCIPIS